MSGALGKSLRPPAGEAPRRFALRLRSTAGDRRGIRLQPSGHLLGIPDPAAGEHGVHRGGRVSAVLAFVPGARALSAVVAGRRFGVAGGFGGSGDRGRAADILPALLRRPDARRVHHPDVDRLADGGLFRHQRVQHSVEIEPGASDVGALDARVVAAVRIGRRPFA